MLLVVLLTVLSTVGCAVGSDDFDYLVFSQQWPQSVCIGINITHEHHNCKISSNVTTFSVHGLWPTKSHTSPPGPNFCDKSAKFDMKALNPIRSELMKYWSNLYKDTPLDSLWAHEWCKHGTCAQSLPSCHGEYNYFKKTLDLNRKFDLYSILKQSNIIPRDHYTYQYTDVLKALSPRGAAPILMCYYDKFTKTQYLSQVEICVSKKFEAIDCKQVQQVSPHVVKRSVTYMSQESNGIVQQATCGGHQSSVHVQMGRLETCRDTETLAYPVLQHMGDLENTLSSSNQL